MVFDTIWKYDTQVLQFFTTAEQLLMERGFFWMHTTLETGVPNIVLSSLTAFVLRVVSSVEGELHLPVMYFISYSCIGRSPLVWKWGSSSRQVAPSSILERQRGGGPLIYSGSGVKSECVWQREHQAHPSQVPLWGWMDPLRKVLTPDWEIEPSQCKIAIEI